MALKAVPKDRPNILVIFGDDIGIPQLSAYTRGLMGYHTPNIDQYPYQLGSSLNPGGINDATLKTQDALKRLKTLESLHLV